MAVAVWLAPAVAVCEWFGVLVAVAVGMLVAVAVGVLVAIMVGVGDGLAATPPVTTNSIKKLAFGTRTSRSPRRLRPYGPPWSLLYVVRLPSGFTVYDVRRAVAIVQVEATWKVTWTRSPAWTPPRLVGGFAVAPLIVK